jgi:hypothetical protein
MDQELAAMYQTPGALSAEDLEKNAEMALFVKLANDKGIDFDTMTDEQVIELYQAVFPKTAAEDDKENGKDNGDKKLPPFMKKDEKDENGDKEKEAAAQAEFAKVQEWQEKCAEADKLGRIMAHAMYQEATKISAAAEGGAAAPATEEPPKEEKPEEAAPSALDDQAAKKAVEKVSAAGLNTDEAIDRINAIFTLGGPGASEKIASAQDYESAVDLRALEILEKAGYEVQWGEQE